MSQLTTADVQNSQTYICCGASTRATYAIQLGLALSCVICAAHQFTVRLLIIRNARSRRGWLGDLFGAPASGCRNVCHSPRPKRRSSCEYERLSLLGAPSRVP